MPKVTKVNLTQRKNYVGLDNPANKLYSPEDTSNYSDTIANPNKVTEGWGGRTNAEAASLQSKLAASANLPYVGVDKNGTPGNNIPSSVVDALGIKDHPSSSRQSVVGSSIGDGSYVSSNNFKHTPKYTGKLAAPVKSKFAPEARGNAGFIKQNMPKLNKSPYDLLDKLFGNDNPLLSNALKYRGRRKRPLMPGNSHKDELLQKYVGGGPSGY